MTTIVVGFIDNPEGKRALDLAIQEARQRKAKLVVIHSMKGGPRTSPDEVIRYRKALEAVKNRLVQENIDHEAHEYVMGRSPAEDLLAAAAEDNADLIVIGYHKRTAAGKLLLGSHAHDVLMGAECPVLSTIAP